MKTNAFFKTSQRAVSFLLLCVICLCALLSGCHGSVKRAAFEVPKELDSSRQYEITFWAKNDTNLTQKKIYEKAVSDFEALYPNIKVNLKLYTDYGKIYNDVIRNISTGTTPNICITYPDHIATYLTGENVVTPLDDLISNKEYGLGGSKLKFDSPTRDEIIPQFLSECYIGGVCYALPYMRSTEACYINKNYVEKLGYTIPDVLTWDFIWEVADAATEKDENGIYKLNGQKVMIPFIYKSTDNMMIQYLRQSGGEYSTENGEIKLFNDTTKDFLYTIAKHTEKGSFSTFKISSYPGNFLNAGQCVFAIDSTAGATWMGSNAPNLDISKDKLVEFETVVMPIPQCDPENPKMISQGPSVCIFNKEDPQIVLASWLFAQYLLTNDVQIAYAGTEGYLPVTSKAHNSDEYKYYLAREGEDNNEHYSVKIQASKLLLEHTKNTFVTPVFVGSTSLRDASGQLIENVVKSVRRKETVDDAYMEKLYSDVSGLYKLDQISISSNGKADLGPMPVSSIVLLSALGGVWILIGAYFVFDNIRKKKKMK